MSSPDPTTRFLLDVMLGKLAVYLRFCGYDTAYALDRDVEEDGLLLALADEEDRIIVTRDTQLTARAPDAILLTARDVEEQLQEMRDAGFSLAVPERPTRCGRCNGSLEAVADDVDRPDYVPDDHSSYRCPDCGQWFWRGSHWAEMAATLGGG